MEKKIKKINRQSGVAMLISVISFLFISVAIISGLVSPSVREFKIANDLIRSRQSFFLSESGVEDAYYRLKNAKPIGSSELITLNGNTATTTIADSGSNEKTISSLGDVFSRQRRNELVLNTGVGDSFNYGAQAGEGGVEMGQNSRIEGTGGVAGNVYSNGPVTGATGATITGSATVATSIALDNQAQSTVCNQDQIVGQNDPQIDFAQSFVPSESRPLSKVSIYIKKVGSSNPPSTIVRIVSNDGSSPSTLSLASTDLQANLVTGSYGWVDATFSNPAIVNVGQTYWLVLDAGENSNRYWVWCKDSNNGFGNGVGKYKKIWDSNESWSAAITGDLTFKTYLGTGVGIIDKVTVSGNAYANTITDSTVNGTKYCQNTNNSPVCNTSQSDPSPLNMPISQGNIDQWKADATAGGVITGDYAVLDDIALGPKEITGNLLMNTSNKTLTVNGTLYIRGYIDIGATGTMIKCAASFGSDSCIIVADGWVHLTNNVTFQGSGASGSFLFLLTTLACTGIPGTGCTHHDGAIDVHNQASGAIFYAPNGMINLHNGVTLTSATAYKLRLDNTATIRYDQGVTNANFSSGPGGGWNIKSWKEI